MKRLMLLLGIAMLALAMHASDVRADRLKDRQKRSSEKKSGIQTKIGVKGGGIGAGPVSAENWPQYDTSPSYSLGLYFESRRPRRIRPAVAFDIYDVRFNQLSWAKKNLFVGSLEMKFPMKRAEPRFAIQPGIGVGMGYLGSKEEGFVKTEKCYFLVLKFFGELLYYYTPKHGLSMELGFVYAPTGTSQESRVRMWAGPMFVYRAGLFL